MSKPGEGWHAVGVAALISAAVHIAAAGLLFSLTHDRRDDDLGDRPEWAALEPPAPPEDEDELELGIEKSDVATVNWLGFEDPTPHEAPKSSVEQPELAPNPSEAAMRETTPTPPSPETSEAEAESEPVEQADAPAEQPSETTAESEPIEDVEPAESAQPPTPEREAVRQPSPAPIESAALVLSDLRDALAAGLKLLAAQTSAATDAHTLAPPTPPAPTSPPPSPPQTPSETARPQPARATPPSPAPSVSSNPPAIQSEKESPATATSEPIEVIPKAGRTAARQGLEIITRRITFQNVTLASARPKNPVVAITFGRDGSVTAARILKSSGAPDVDEPVLNSVYGWKAKGKDLDKLPPGDRAGITIEMRIILLD